MEKLDEAAIPETEYGYWIWPTGEVHAVGFMDHYRLAKMTVHKGVSGAIMDSGWIRIIASPRDRTFSLDIPTIVTKRAMRSLLKVMQASEAKIFHVEITVKRNSNTDDPRSMARWEVSRIDAMHFIDENVKLVNQFDENEQLSEIPEAIRGRSDLSHWRDMLK